MKKLLIWILSVILIVAVSFHLTPPPRHASLRPPPPGVGPLGINIYTGNHLVVLGLPLHQQAYQNLVRANPCCIPSGVSHMGRLGLPVRSL